jgi:hypothetical protein
VRRVAAVSLFAVALILVPTVPSYAWGHGTIEILGVHEDLLLEPPDERVRCLREHLPPQGRET